MGVGAGPYMYVVVVQKFTFAISSPDEFLFYNIIGYDRLKLSYKFIPKNEILGTPLTIALYLLGTDELHNTGSEAGSEKS